MQPSARREQLAHECGDPGDDVLAIVEHEEEVAVGQRRAQQLARRPARGRLAHAERSEHGLGHQRVGSEARQLDYAHAVAMLILDAFGDLQGQAGLAGAPGARERDEPPGSEEIDQLTQLPLAPHERGRRRRQASRAARRGVQRRERRRHTLRAGLVETNRPDDVAQAMRSQIEQRDSRRELCDEPDRRFRDDDLPAVRDTENPGRLMEGHAEQLVAHLGDLSGVNRHPDPNGRTARPGLCCEGALGLDGSGHRVAGRTEDEDAAVAAAGISVAPAGTHGTHEDRTLALDHTHEGVAERREQPRGAFHVGEEQRHDARVLHVVRAGAAGGRPHLHRRPQALPPMQPGGWVHGAAAAIPVGPLRGDSAH